MAGELPLETLRIRVHGDADLPTLIYLPGIHGDWTLVGDFRKQLAGHVRFVEFIYPRTLTWSLDDYAAAIETALAENHITHGWLLGESFGSQVLWALVRRKQFTAQGIILAGGFVKYPILWGVRFAYTTFERIPLRALEGLLKIYGKLARLRYRRSPETVANIQEFIERRTELDRLAALHRLTLILNHDPRATARATSLPVFYVSGWVDPIVPWPLVRRWLRKQCPSLRADKIIFPADHNVLGTAPTQSARQILSWLKG
jgi:pimeloyl-ACP methyl ester carboxylesterase